MQVYRRDFILTYYWFRWLFNVCVLAWPCRVFKEENLCESERDFLPNCMALAPYVHFKWNSHIFETGIFNLNCWYAVHVAKKEALTSLILRDLLLTWRALVSANTSGFMIPVFWRETHLSLWPLQKIIVWSAPEQCQQPAHLGFCLVGCISICLVINRYPEIFSEIFSCLDICLCLFIKDKLNDI